MLYEATPAWVALFTASAAHLSGGSTVRPRVRSLASWAVAATAVGALVLIPGALSSAARSSDSLSYASLPDAPVDGRALVFAHGSWSSRLVARLSAGGMRRDSVETALRRNDICAVEHYTAWREAAPSTRGTLPPTLDLEQLPGTPPHLRRARLSDGNDVWTDPGAPRDALCAREARADRQGVVELEPLLWQAPPLAGFDVIVARDMGPELNARTRAALGNPSAFIFTPSGGGSTPPFLMDYEEGIALLWAVPAGALAFPSSR
jgi:hypothetical protein